MAGEESAASANIPAWKKLGLKLKYAKDPIEEEIEANKGKGKSSTKGAAAETENAGATNESALKEEGKKQRKSKKRRHEDDEEEDVKKNKADSSEKKKSKKKRVSFSADAKVHDGEESDHDQAASDADADDEDSSKTDGPGEKNGIEEGGKKKKKEKKKNKSKDGQSTTGDNGSPRIHETPILSYLGLYYKHRDAWKFQKNRETHLFKHILSLEHVPTQYNAALLAYLQGLKSEGAKQRLREIAEEVVKAEIEGASAEGNADSTEETQEKPEQDMANYNKAVDAFKAHLSEDKKDELDRVHSADELGGETLKKLEKRQRAELLLFAVNGALYSFQKPKPPPAQKGKGAKKATPAKKKKKNRTAFVEISSSSESDSSSDSDSDSDDDTAKKSKTKKPQPKKKSRKDSSDSSDSSSDSDSTSSGGSSSS
ncbi:hypothetical protein P170DRAFT_434606 [Aspergillus steynii IBT 23096]|uniref:WKF domain-containing protein n=1 Tax=Aspergillus steynii IBT 23096 TaxID=1392250 RepID=A0A2I2GJ83_9EURO|nr:uncharacterized protein P170DRAFT_434606 [Aspergillus steynii IBT 23096]PLB52887.1 hypothetical protein P170DRAFT_434606 [Aspergillus steynii IBT 23096]